MAKTRVSKFRVWDHQKGDSVIAPRMATAEFIAGANGTEILGTAIEVDSGVLDADGRAPLNIQPNRPVKNAAELKALVLDHARRKNGALEGAQFTWVVRVDASEETNGANWRLILRRETQGLAPKLDDSTRAIQAQFNLG
ncbi:MAG: hypothetical protein AB7M05_18155 [Alphaproteobacteria bacterium]